MPRKPRICVFTSHPLFDRRVFHREGKSLVKFGYDVTVIGDGDGLPREVDGIRAVPVRRQPGLRNRWRYLRQVRDAALAEPDVDLFHTDDYDQMPNAMHILRATGKPMVLDIHEMYADFYGRRFGRGGVGAWAVRALFVGFENFVASRVKNVILVYNQQRERFERLGCRVIHVDNYATTRDYTAEPVSDALWDARRNVVVHVGAMAMIRGVDEMLGMAHLFKKAGRPVRMIFTELFYSPRDREDFERVRARYDTDGVVELTPVLPANRLPELINRGSVGLALLYPDGDLQYSMPTKFFEYMACSVPVVASRWPTSERLVEQSGCGLVVRDNKSAEQYAEAVARILDDPALARRMGEAGRQAFLKTFNWEAQEPAMRDFYAAILRESGVEAA